eukprot:3556107-Rhodomonas_salina.1
MMINVPMVTVLIQFPTVASSECQCSQDSGQLVLIGRGKKWCVCGQKQCPFNGKSRSRRDRSFSPPRSFSSESKTMMLHSQPPFDGLPIPQPNFDEAPGGGVRIFKPKMNPPRFLAERSVGAGRAVLQDAF